MMSAWHQRFNRSSVELAGLLQCSGFCVVGGGGVLILFEQFRHTIFKVCEVCFGGGYQLRGVRASLCVGRACGQVRI